MTASTSADGLARYVQGWNPEPVLTVDAVDPATAQQLAATLDLPEVFESGSALPPLWQWVYFTDWPPTADLGADGHPLAGHFLPPIPNRRRMFAGGRLTVTSPLTLGAPAERHAGITAIKVKSGRSGELMFVTVRYDYRQNGETALVEEQDIVYRSDSGASTAFTRGTEPLPDTDVAWSARPTTTPPLLFRFSALTANAHRIHYDEAYTTGTEGYPGLVVHGPLLAVYMAELVRARAADRPVREFEFRLEKPVFVDEAIEVQGTPDRDTVQLAVVSGGGTVHASASARLA